jgi:hypothetical protein
MRVASERDFLGSRVLVCGLVKCLIALVGAPGFEPGTPSPPDWCANRAALRSANHNHTSKLPPFGAQGCTLMAGNGREAGAR